MKSINIFLLTILSLFLLLAITAATVSHNASEITAGTFGTGDYTFIGNVELQKGNEVFLSIRNTESSGKQYALVSAGSLGGIGVGKFSIYDTTAGVSRLTIDSSGNVGIGTANPSQRLHVIGNVRIDGVVSASSFGSLSPLIFTVSGTERMRIDDSGNVGIGTTGPGQKLDVAGYVKGQGICIGSDCRTSWPADTVVVGGTNPTCPSGYEIFFRRWLSRTCSGSCAWAGGTTCTTPSGWADITDSPGPWDPAVAGSLYCTFYESPGGAPCDPMSSYRCHPNSWDRMLCVKT